MVLSNHVGLLTCFNMIEHIMGVNVKATKPETMTEPANAKANSVKSFPVRPGVKAKGAYTAAKVSVIATTAKPTSRAPRIAA